MRLGNEKRFWTKCVQLVFHFSFEQNGQRARFENDHSYYCYICYCSHCSMFDMLRKSKMLWIVNRLLINIIRLF